MADGEPVNTLNVLIKTTMSSEIAEMAKERFEDVGSHGMSVSYLDCVYFEGGTYEQNGRRWRSGTGW